MAPRSSVCSRRKSGIKELSVSGICFYLKISQARATSFSHLSSRLSDIAKEFHTTPTAQRYREFVRFSFTYSRPEGQKSMGLAPSATHRAHAARHCNCCRLAAAPLSPRDEPRLQVHRIPSGFRSMMPCFDGAREGCTRA